MAFITTDDKKPDLSFTGVGKVFDPKLNLYVDVIMEFNTSEIEFEQSDGEAFVHMKLDLDIESETYWKLTKK